MSKKIDINYANLNKEAEKYLKQFENSKRPLSKKALQLKNNISRAINNNSTRNLKEIKEILSKQCKTNYKKVLNSAEKESKINIKKTGNVNKISTEIVNKKINGKTIDNRIINNNKKLLKDCHKIIKTETEKGTSVPKMSKMLRDKFNIDKNRAKLIARTESHRVREESTYKGYIANKVNGISQKVQWLATKDSRTRDTHMNLDGKFADENLYFHSSGGMTHYPGGFGIAREDCNCRCTTIIITDPKKSDGILNFDDDSFDAEAQAWVEENLK
jgi:SPP1 gp7 family putative phage head morphogenesis protein